MIPHVTETSWPSSDCVRKIVTEYIQEPDNYKKDQSSDNVLVIGTEPGGYFYIQTERWAFDNIEELFRILMDFKFKVEFCNESSENKN